MKILRDVTKGRELQDGVHELRQLWQQARSDHRCALDPQEVFDELEAKYQAIAGTEP